MSDSQQENDYDKLGRINQIRYNIDGNLMTIASEFSYDKNNLLQGYNLPLAGISNTARNIYGFIPLVEFIDETNEVYHINKSDFENSFQKAAFLTHASKPLMEELLKNGAVRLNKAVNPTKDFLEIRDSISYEGSINALSQLKHHSNEVYD